MHAVAAIVYRQGTHLINLFVAQGSSKERTPTMKTAQGFNVELWAEQGLKFCAISDVSVEELQDFGA